MQPVCWKCGASLRVDVGRPGGVSKYATTGQQWHGQSYRTQVEALGPQAPDLAPGQVARFETPLRAQSIVSDVLVPALQAAGYGLAAMLVSIPAPWLLPKSVPWYAPALVLPTVTGGAFFVTSGAARRLLMRVEEFTGQDIDGDGKVGDIAVDLNADLDKGHGNTQKTRVTIPLSQVRAWRKFCQDVTVGECKFSGNAAVAHGLDRAWFNGLIERWAGLDPKRALIDPSSVGPRKTLKLTPAGEKRIELDAHAPLPRLMSLLEAMTGTDR